MLESLAVRYTREVGDHLRYLATWLPQTLVEVGDVGVVVDREFRKIDTLRERGIPFDIRSTKALSRMRYVSDSGVSTHFKGLGEVPPHGSVLVEAEAGWIIDFRQRHGVLFDMHGGRHSVLADPARIYAEILQRFKRREWMKQEVVVAEVVEAAALTVLVSALDGGRIELAAKSSVSAPESLADAALGIGVRRSTGMATEIVAAQGVTPLFRGAKVHQGLWSPKAGIVAKHFSPPSPPENEDFVVGEYSYDEVADG